MLLKSHQNRDLANINIHFLNNVVPWCTRTVRAGVCIFSMLDETFLNNNISSKSHQYWRLDNISICFQNNVRFLGVQCTMYMHLNLQYVGSSKEPLSATMFNQNKFGIQGWRKHFCCESGDKFLLFRSKC